jgi:hypothetical protein
MSLKFYLAFLALGIFATVFPRFLHRQGRFLEAWGGRLTALRAAFLIVALTIGVNALLVRLVRQPVPRVHDEFSYLLAADTFAHGRLTNPPHPLWPFLESFHVLQQPTRMSKYPPAQGLVLALGQKLGSPLYGAWLTGAAFALAVFYLISAWLPAGWALAGALLAIVHPLAIDWSNGFWGGGVQAAGGALLAGVLSRAFREPRWSHGCLGGVAVAALAMSRPFEGALFTVGIGMVFAVALFRQGKRHGVAVLRVLLPGFVGALAAGAVFLGLYNKAVTGNAMTMPYVVYEKAYGSCPVFVAQPAKPEPEARHAIFEAMGRSDRATFDSQQDRAGWLKAVVSQKLLPVFSQFTAGGLLLLPILWAFFAKENATAIRIGALLLGVLCLAETGVVWMFSHYVASVFGITIALTMVGLREMRLKLGERGVCFTRLFVLLTAALALFFYASRMQKRSVNDRWDLDRATLAARLAKLPEKSLVLVTFEPGHNPNQNWVQNDADVDASKVVWAHSMADNSALLNYYPDRRVWRLRVSHSHQELTPPIPQ